MERLDKLFSLSMILSRKEFKKAVKDKRISVNGVILTNSDIKIDENIDVVMLDSTVVNLTKYIYIMLNKPLGVVSSTYEKNEKTVLDIIPKEYLRRDLFPCGRLDKDTTGLIILTNDGESTHKNLSPKNNIEKRYYFELENNLSNSSKTKLEAGVTLQDSTKTKECSIDMIDSKKGYITITEGKYHEIRRMFAYVSNKVLVLKRLSFKGIELDSSLKEGESRLLTDDEIKIFKGL